MKNILKQIVFALQIIRLSPLIIPFLLTTNQEIIVHDLQRWIDILGWKGKANKVQLLRLLKEAQEFRNLYYHRLFKGNFLGRFLMYLLSPIYRPCAYFLLDNSCNIGAGLFIQHGLSTIIMADMGTNCWINQQVTIGHKDKTGRPKIGNNVRITAGAKVIGNIRIGNNVTVGANAVVIKDVPDNCVIVGVPAYIVKKNGVAVKEEL